MPSHPEIQARAHEELDRVVGRERMPDLSDRDSLPYISAIYKEVQRFHPVVPLGVPHASTEEDEYKGYRIPKGSVMVPNVW